MSVFRATTRSMGNRTFETRVGAHAFITDHGGSGPTPPDFFVVSLTACIGVYVSGYCRKAGIDTTDMSIDLECEKSEHVMSKFRMAVHLPNADLGARAAAVQRVADACLVHATIRTFGDCPITVRDRRSTLARVI